MDTLNKYFRYTIGLFKDKKIDSKAQSRLSNKIQDDIVNYLANEGFGIINLENGNIITAQGGQKVLTVCNNQFRPIREYDTLQGALKGSSINDYK